MHDCIALQVLTTTLGRHQFNTRLKGSSDDQYVLLFDVDAPLLATRTTSVDQTHHVVQSSVGTSGTTSPAIVASVVLVAWTRAEIPTQARVSLPCGLRDDNDSHSFPLQWRATGVLGDALPTVYTSSQGSTDCGRLDLLLTQAPMYLEPV